MGWEGPSAFSAFFLYRVRIADFENPTDRLYCDRPYPKGPKIEKIQDLPSGLKISSEPPTKALFLWGGGEYGSSRLTLSGVIEVFKRDWNFKRDSVFFKIGALSREEESVHDHHRRNIFWTTFLALKKNFPGQWWIQRPCKIYHQNLSFVAPFLSAKKKILTGAGWCMVSFFSLG